MDPSPNALPSRLPDPGPAGRPSPEPDSAESLSAESVSSELLRSALEPEASSVERVLRAARAAQTGARSSAPEARGPFRLIATLAATTALAASLILALPGWRGPASEPPASVRISISNQGGIVLARRSDESGGWIVRSGSTEPAPSSQIILVSHGD